MGVSGLALGGRKALIGLAIVILGAVGSPLPAGAEAQNVPEPVLNYLASIGMDPAAVVIQTGDRNYAGPNCPGADWDCTQASRVVQLGSEQNQVECTGGGGSVTGATETCTVMQGVPGQTTGSNTARCIERSSSPAAVQICSIEQNGANNAAFVLQEVTASDDGDQTSSTPTQTADQTTEVTQTTGSGGTNAVSVAQQVTQRLHRGTHQSQDAHQELTINQNAPGVGSNRSFVEQGQRQDAHGAATQHQNTSFSGSATPCPAATLYGVGNSPNQCAFIHQGTDSGSNDNQINQSVDETLRSPTATDQIQGSFVGGIKAQIDLDAGTGQSTNRARQQKNQDAHGPTTANQQQIDPMGCCGFSAQGDTSSRETLNQDSAQKASGTAAVQQLEVFGFVHTPTGGSCSIAQQASDNADSSSQSSELADCTAGLGFFTDCTSGVIAGLSPRRTEPVGACTSAPFFGGGD